MSVRKRKNEKCQVIDEDTVPGAGELKQHILIKHPISQWAKPL